MNWNCSKVALALAVLFVAGGCQHVSTDAAFAEVQARVSQRLNMDVHWNHGESDGAEPLANLPTKELAADDAVRTALLNNRGLQAEFEDIGIAHADFMQAGRLSNPRLNMTYRPPVSSGPAATASLDLTQRFLELVLMPLRKKVAAAQFE